MIEMKTLSSREKWLEARSNYIGGSDASAVIGLNPYKTNLELWQEKNGLVQPEDISGKPYVQYGTQAEMHLRGLFRLDFPEYQVEYTENNLWLNDKYPFAHASLDGWLTDQDGRKGILEIKTTNYNAKDNWWYNGEEIVPIYYESQGRHYMAVMNIDRVYFCCLYGNSEDEAIIRRIDRDMAYKEELIALEGLLGESCPHKNAASLCGSGR